jgi:hypothetical protein
MQPPAEARGCLKVCSSQNKWPQVNKKSNKFTFNYCNAWLRTGPKLKLPARLEVVWNSAAVTANGLRKASLKVFLSSTKSQTSLHLITAMIGSKQTSTQPCIQRRPEAVWNSVAFTANGLRKASVKVFLSSTKRKTSLQLITGMIGSGRTST